MSEATQARTAQVSEEDCFILCDARVNGYPTQHASKGFKDLFRFAEGENASRSDKLDGCSGVADSEAGVAAATSLTGLSGEDVVSGLQLLEKGASETCAAAVAGEGGQKAGSVLMVKARRGGELFSCLLSVMLHRHPKTGWSFLAGLHKDVTSTVPVGKLLGAAAHGQQQVQEMLRGLQADVGEQEAKLVQPDSVVRFQEDFEKAWHGFLASKETSWYEGMRSSGMGSTGSSHSKPGSDSSAKKGKQKSKLARSEVSAATTASNVSFRRKTSQEATQEAASSTTTTQASELPEASESSRLSHHLLELLEPAGGTESSVKICRRMVVGRTTILQDERHKVEGRHGTIGKQELSGIDFPLAIFDPSQPGLPAVLCSASFASFMGCPSQEGKIESLRLADLPLGLADTGEREVVLAFLDAAARGEYCPGFLFAAPGWVQDGFEQVRLLPEGELVLPDVNVTRSGAASESMVYLKQVELDDKMYILALQASQPDLIFIGERLEDRRWLDFLCLDARMDVLLQALAAHFWFSAPMRRQIPSGDGPLATKGLSLIACL